jgi:hypothetical protein
VNNLHQNKKHRYTLNSKERTIIHKYFDNELMDRLDSSGPQKNKVVKGKWVSRGTIPVVRCSLTCKCGGQVYVPDGLPEIFDIWGICSKCGAEH